MPAPKQLIRQHDFSSGELIEHAKRADDDPIVRSGARTASNLRILATRKVENRPGRSILYANERRVDRVRVTSSVSYDFCFSAGILRIRDSTGAIVAAQGGMPWDATDVGRIVHELVNRDVVICFDGYRPIVARWDGSIAWTFQKFTFYTDGYNIVRSPFYKLAEPYVTLQPSSETGSVTLTASHSIFTSAYIGTRVRWLEQQIEITAVASGTSATGTIIGSLPFTWDVTISDGNTSRLRIGDVIGELDGLLQMIVTGIPSTLRFQGVLIKGSTIPASGTNWLDTTGHIVGVTASRTGISPQALVYWDEEVASDARGWPQSCFLDRGRFGFCDFPGLPGAIAWSRIAFYDDFLVGALASDPILELAPKRARVLHVIGGSDEFVFTDRGIYNIPISASTPLAPGSVQFQKITDAGAARVRPTEIPEGPVFVNAGLTKVQAIVGTGQSARPYIVRDVSELHSHLFSSPVCIAVGVDGPFSETYVFVVNDDGTMAVGRFDSGKEWVGFLPWSGEGDIEWVSASGSAVLVTAKYTPDETDIRLTEEIDTATYLDANVLVASIPSALGDGTDSDILLYPAGGTRIGDLTAAGGLAAAFDGTTSQDAAAAASKTSATSGYIGKTLDVALPCKKVEIYPSNNNGFSSVTPLTITLYGKQGAAPSNATDGTSLGTTGSIADTTSMQTINSSNTATAYDHLWVTITQSSGTIYVAEVRFYTPGLTRAAPGGGTDDLWFLAGATVRVMDGLRDLGTREVSAAGVLVEVEGEDLSGADIAVGFDWTATLEPFLPHIPSGQSHGQTIDKRGVGHFAVAFQQSTGFLVQKSDGTSARRVAPFAAGDNQDGDPPLREGVETFSIAGQEHDHRIQVVKDTPGPLRILELSTEI